MTHARAHAHVLILVLAPALALTAACGRSWAPSPELTPPRPPEPIPRPAPSPAPPPAADPAAAREAGAAAITADVLRDHIARLASDEFEGRGPTTRGDQVTRAYLVEQLKAMGYEPGGPGGAWE